MEQLDLNKATANIMLIVDDDESRTSAHDVVREIGNRNPTLLDGATVSAGRDPEGRITIKVELASGVTHGYIQTGYRTPADFACRIAQIEHGPRK